MELHNLNVSEFQELDLEKWLGQVIFCITDNDRKRHSLTRKELIFNARDKDGGGHFDPVLSHEGYLKSKYGEILAIINEGSEEEDITTKDFHLEMLRQLGHEILNSLSINKYIKS